MANATEIQNRIKSIQDTMKITKAMYMISSTKLQKAKKSLEQTEPFFYGIQAQIGRVLRHIPDIQHIYFDNREKDQRETVKRQAYIIITADKGMAGAYNHNILKTAQGLYEHASDPHMFVVGELGRQYFAAHQIPVEEQFHYTAQNPTMHRARTIQEHIIQKYLDDELDEVYVVYTKMINSMAQEVETVQLLPLVRADFGSKVPSEILLSTYQEQFRLLPSPEAVIESMVPNYITGFIYGALIEAFSSEQNARMQAMQAATNNAEAMLHDLSVEYNRVRQAAIIQEITEVIGGAKALKRKKAKKGVVA